MRIKQQTQDRLVLGDTSGMRAAKATLVVLSIGLLGLAALAPSGEGSGWWRVGLGVLAALAGAQFLGSLLDSGIVIDKTTASITIRARYLWWIDRRRTIPFSDVNSVVVDHDIHHPVGPFGQMSSAQHSWRLSLDIGEKLVIDFDRTDSMEKGLEMTSLAESISQFLGKELVANSPQRG